MTQPASPQFPAPLTPEVVGQAVRQLQLSLENELREFGLVLFPERVEPSYGGWLLPAEHRGSTAMHKSYELHRLIEKVEDRLQDILHSTVTVDLLSAASRNGS